MKYKFLIISSFIFLSACQDKEPEHPLVDPEDTILVLVDGSPVTLPMLEYMMTVRGISEDDHEAMREQLDELIRLQAVANAARAEGMDREPRVRAQRMIRDLEALQLRYFDQMYRDYPVTDEDIEAIYRSQVERSGDRQYLIETILFQDQAEALSNLAAVEDGQTEFEQLKSTARERGQLIDEALWVDGSQLPVDIAALLAETETGEILGLPLQTPQGWRLLRVVDIRGVEVPALEEVHEGIARHLVRQRLEALVQDLFESAEITPMLPLEDATD
jgi:peptidyl-prolyl cis-trans isomerase C